MEPKSVRQRVERKVATILFVDVADSVQLLSGFDIEETSHALTYVIDNLERIVTRHGGTVVSRLGDGIMVVFGAPNALENHEVRAVKAAIEIHEEWNLGGEFASLANNLSFYTSAHCGEILSRQDDNRNVPIEVFGETIHLAARLNKLIGAGVVVVSEEMADKLQPYANCEKVADFQIKGFDPEIAVFRVDSIRQSALEMHGALEDGLSPFVGRERELSWLVARFKAGVEGSGGVFRVVAEAGAGKTRLLHEFRKETTKEDLWVFQLRCESFVESLAYAPMRSALGPYLSGASLEGDQKLQDIFARQSEKFFKDNERALAAQALVGTLSSNASWNGLSSDQKAVHIERMLGDFFLMISQDRPVVIEIEDVHWADAETLRWLANLRSRIKNARVCVITTSRPPAKEVSAPPYWSDEINLSLLGASFLGAIVRSKDGLSKLDNAAIERVSLMSGGNPLFAEECAKFLHELGHEAAALNEEAIERIFRLRIMGSDTQSILAARLDELSEDVREVVAACSAVGPRFDDKIVESVLKKPTPALVGALQTLLAAEIIFRTQPGAREPYRFKHAITHEVAYRTMTRRTREEYHARILHSYEERLGDSALEQADLLREHARQAGDVPSTIHYQHHTALAALNRSANSDCLRLLRDCLDMARTLPEKTENLSLLVDLNFDLRNCLEIIEPAEIFEALQDAERICEHIDDRARQARANSYLTHAHWVAGNLRKALAYGEDAVEEAERLRNSAIRIPAMYHLALVHLGLGHHAKAKKTFSDVITASEQSNSPVLHHLNVAPEVLSRIYLSRCLAEMGEYDSARETAMTARDQAKSERENYAFAFTELALGHIAVAADDHEEAVHWLSRSVSGFNASKATVMLPVSQAFLGYALALTTQYQKATPIIEDAIASSMRLKVWQQQGLRTAFLSECQIGVGNIEGAMETLRFARRLSKQHQDEPALAFINYQTARAFHLSNGTLDRKHHTLLVETINGAENMQMHSLATKCRRMLDA